MAVCVALPRAEVVVSGANVDACNGAYHDEELSDCSSRNHVYKNNSGSIIFFAHGQWRLKTQKSSSDFIYVIDSDAAVPPTGKWGHKDGTGVCNVEVFLVAIVMHHVMHHPPDVCFIVFVLDS